MKNTFIRSFFSLCVLFSTLLAQKDSTEITLKVSETSGFLGMGKPLFVTIALGTFNRDEVLTSDNVNAGTLYYFVLRDSGTWKIDESFIKEELVKLTIRQGGAMFHLEASSPAVQVNNHYVLLLGCKKDLALNKPLLFTFPLKHTIDSATMIIPQHYWPGRTKLSQQMETAGKAVAAEKYLDAISIFDQLMLDQTLSIFTDYETIGPKRLEAYRRLCDTYRQQFREMIESKPADTKQTITTTEEFLARFNAIAKDVVSAVPQQQSTVPDTAPFIDSVQETISKVSLVEDSLHQALDDQTIRFIVEGSSAGKIDFKYKYIIETLAYAYLSLNFSDSTTRELKVTVPEDLRTRLEKYSIQNAFETFLRTVNKRWVANQPMFPDGFLAHLQKDTSQFPLPFYSMLKAVQDFYSKSYPSAKAEIRQVMKKSYIYELTERVDQLRILINAREAHIPKEVLQRLAEGKRAEEQGDKEKAIELYKDAMLISEDYAPAACAMGNLYDRSGDSYMANNFFQKAISVDSQYYSAYRSLYTNFFKNATFKPMIDLLTQALMHGNDFFDFHYYLGIAYNGSAQYDLAIEQYERALELNDNSIEANIQMGISYQNMKSYSKAREYFRRAITIDPENQTATENLKRLDDLQKKF